VRPVAAGCPTQRLLECALRGCVLPERRVRDTLALPTGNELGASPQLTSALHVLVRVPMLIGRDASAVRVPCGRVVVRMVVRVRVPTLRDVLRGRLARRKAVLEGTDWLAGHDAFGTSIRFQVELLVAVDSQRRGEYLACVDGWVLPAAAAAR